MRKQRSGHIISISSSAGLAAGSPLVVVGDGRHGIVRRLLREEFRAKESRFTIVVAMPNGAISACRDSIQPSRPNFDAA